jgi:hypothetical protein
MVLMKTLRFRYFSYSFLFLLFALGLVLNQNGLAAETGAVRSASIITGFVYDQNRTPLARIDVELTSASAGVSSIRTRTDESGRYQFNNIEDGRYTVTVRPFRYNLLDQSEEVVVQTVSLLGGGSGYFNKDFYLKSKAGGLGDTTTGVIFAQDVPREAEELFKKADKEFSDNKSSEGIKTLVEAIKVFPTYYAATQRLGIEVLKTKQYMEATRLFMRAVGINPKSSRAFYYMGFSLNQLGKKYNPSALKALNKAAELAPASWEVVYLIGKIERQQGNYIDAEKHLLKSKKLADMRVPDIHIELAQLYGNNLKQYGKAADELELYLKASKKKDEKIKKQISDLRTKAKKSS